MQCRAGASLSILSPVTHFRGKNVGLGGRSQDLSQLYLECSSLGSTNPIMPFVPLVFGDSIILGQFEKLIKRPKLPLPCWDLLLIFQAALPQQQRPWNPIAPIFPATSPRECIPLLFHRSAESPESGKSPFCAVCHKIHVCLACVSPTQIPLAWRSRWLR